MTYIKDLINIPDHVGRGDFVLRLSEGVTDPEGTIRHYQVTPHLVDCFDQALNLVKGSLQGTGGRSSSKAAYLHGSFGSGKSHFMAIHGGYADFIGRTQPDAPAPSVFLAEGLLANAEQQREMMGDPKFFEQLNKGNGGGSGGLGNLTRLSLFEGCEARNPWKPGGGSRS